MKNVAIICIAVLAPSLFAFSQGQPKRADQYEPIGKVATRAGAGTSFWSHELDRYYVAAPANGSEHAAILVYAPVD